MTSALARTTTGLTRAGVTLTIIALLTAVAAAATSFLLTSRLSNEDALRAEMDTIVASVSDEAVANTESFLTPAVSTSNFLGSFLADGVLDPDDTSARMLLLDILESNALFEGIFVGSADGEFLYVSRLDRSVGEAAAFAVKRISIDDERRVEVFTYDRNKQELSSGRDDGDSYDPRARVWYEQAAASANGAWTDPYVFFTSGLPGVTRAFPVRIDGELEHVVGVDVRIAELSTFIAERAPSPNGAAFIMTKSQLMVAYSDPEAIEDGTSLRHAYEIFDPALQVAGATIEQRFIGDVANRSEAVTLDGQDAQFVYTALETNPDWVVTAWSPSSDFLAQVRSNQRTSTLISLGLGIVILVELLGAAIWVSRRLSRNQRQLTESKAASEQSSIERDHAQQELANTIDQLAASNRELEQYAYAAAHDLRTPLRAIGGYSELIGREVESDDADLDRIREWSDRIVAGYDRMGRTMDNLLDHARIATVEIDLRDLDCIDTNPVATSVISDLSSALDSVGGSVTVGPLPRARIDPLQLARVFQNLLENAIRFRDPDRTLTIQIDGIDDGHQSRFWIRDNGIGIASPDQSRIFETFNHAHDSSGLGLGLSLVRRIVQDHGGEISAESTLGEGSVFEVTLPSTKLVSTP